MVTPAFRPTPVYMTMTGLHNIAPKYHEGTQDPKEIVKVLQIYIDRDLHVFCMNSLQQKNTIVGLI